MLHRCIGTITPVLQKLQHKIKIKPEDGTFKIVKLFYENGNSQHLHKRFPTKQAIHRQRGTEKLPLNHKKTTTLGRLIIVFCLYNRRRDNKIGKIRHQILGVLINLKLLFRQYVDSVVFKARRNLGLIK